ncbi:DNA adenine methylase [Yersinia pseudotuberculosis]|uniref:Site-specific DNA-methyltransferase (adenine-specific) n=2 Tax=Yersinia pseudotuberculosis complex TaxID=1649845 RepID=A0A0H3B067_YERPY|nr:MULTISPECIES: Dam family site-specific DNA-(adenine-N6)-methyltransferase [Yersinia pseudotuberculosis complex]AJJ58037.1 DNA adenine methylase family protein [Yersinia pseudotuberculosis YPIII]AYW86950.1 Dam family site-specific DNA-(adenine-N6)-methyltransferase [Yersinia pseudotuberculosis]MBK1425982.1 Dam family site-specific DNA-(adenine-N6)-methyltransferase [Yersinia pseudotuberculosis]CRG51184.1 DNA adenine methylase [Yersinia wautersii]SQA61769.1 DNA adenine methylase [Yersinia pse
MKETKLNRSPLKWAGSKARIMPVLRPHLPAGKRLVEPFAGSCSVMLNTDYDEYLIADINAHLINFYNMARCETNDLINMASSLFFTANTPEQYYIFRNIFNSGNRDELSMAVIFLYLNRHCFNGLCRYNKLGGFNVPYGKYKSPYFPEAEIRFFAEKAKKAIFICCDFSEALEMTLPGDVIYCDPPYIPASITANFTGYHADGFNNDQQYRLSVLLARAAENGCHAIASNSDTHISRDLYHNFTLHDIVAPRSVNCKGEGRSSVSEIIATKSPASVSEKIYRASNKAIPF